MKPLIGEGVASYMINDIRNRRSIHLYGDLAGFDAFQLGEPEGQHAVLIGRVDPAGVDLTVNGHSLYERGAPVSFDAKTVSTSIKSNRQTSIVLTLREGSAKVRFWTSDLNADYVRFNADYTT